MIYSYLCCTECPEDELGFEDIPSAKGCYKVLTYNLEWSIAALECRTLHRDAHLVVISNRAEQNAVGAVIDTAENRGNFITICTV